MRMATMRESRDSDRFLVNTRVQSHALLHRGFGTSVHIMHACLKHSTWYFLSISYTGYFLYLCKLALL